MKLSNLFISLVLLVSALIPVALAQRSTVLVDFRQEGSCFPRCENYRLLIYRDGRTRLMGTSNILSGRSADGSITMDELAALREAFAKARFSQLRPDYLSDKTCTASVSEGQVFVIRYWTRGKYKTVKHFSECQSSDDAVSLQLGRLKDLEKDIPKMAKVEKLIEIALRGRPEQARSRP